MNWGALFRGTSSRNNDSDTSGPDETADITGVVRQAAAPASEVAAEVAEPGKIEEPIAAAPQEAAAVTDQFVHESETPAADESGHISVPPPANDALIAAPLQLETIEKEFLPEALSEVKAEAPAVAETRAPDLQTVDEVVARVIERLQPQIIEVINRELLRPVVEALVKSELEKK